MKTLSLKARRVARSIGRSEARKRFTASRQVPIASPMLPLMSTATTSSRSDSEPMKWVTSCGRSSSNTRKSPCRRPFTSRPLRSVTVAATCTTSTSTAGVKVEPSVRTESTRREPSVSRARARMLWAETPVPASQEHSHGGASREQTGCPSAEKTSRRTGRPAGSTRARSVTSPLT